MQRTVTEFVWTESEVFDRLRHVWPSPAHVCLPGVRNGTGFARRESTADAVVMSVYPSRGLWLAGVEIKISRSDWKRELARPDKAAAIQKYCHFWFVAAPKGVVPVEEVPETWGLIEVERNTAKIMRKAPGQKPETIDLLLLGSILRKVESCTEPSALVAGKIAKAIEDARHGWIDDSKDELAELQALISDFEKASGLELRRRWEMGRIGEAVRKIVDAGSPVSAFEGLRSQYEQAQKILTKIGEGLAELKQVGAPEAEGD